VFCRNYRNIEVRAVNTSQVIQAMIQHVRAP
jgi:hypothetical protein